MLIGHVSQIQKDLPLSCCAQAAIASILRALKDFVVVLPAPRQHCLRHPHSDQIQDNLTINGTIQDVLEYISVANDPTTTARRDETMGAVRPSVDHSSQDRYKPTHHLCDIENWGRAGVAPLWDGIDYLEHVPGTPRHAPGPGECARVSCSFNSAIYWCNEVRTCILFTGSPPPPPLEARGTDLINEY